MLRVEARAEILNESTMKTMSQVADLADCPETLDEARGMLRALTREIVPLRRENARLRDVVRSAYLHQLGNLGELDQRTLRGDLAIFGRNEPV